MTDRTVFRYSLFSRLNASPNSRLGQNLDGRQISRSSGDVQVCSKLNLVSALDISDGLPSGTGTSACTVRRLLHIPLSDERVDFRMMLEVTVRKEDKWDLPQIWTRQEEFAMVAEPQQARFQMFPGQRP